MYVIYREEKTSGRKQYRGYNGKVIWTESIDSSTVTYDKLVTVRQDMKRQCRDKRYNFLWEAIDA